MKIELPEGLKADLPQSPFGKILSATPVVMTVVATALAGLASSEMTSAQYDRSLAAQLQSKAGDQWNFFQGKKLRGALQHNTLDAIFSTSEVHPLERTTLGSTLANTPAGTALESPAGQQALAVLIEGELPRVSTTPAPVVPTVHAALGALEATRPDAELTALIALVDDNVLESALRNAQAQVLALDAVIKPVAQVIDAIEKQLGHPGTAVTLRRDFTAARLRYNALRYDAESRLNQAIASLYELQVRKENLSADRHHRRSQKFFYGMLAAQMGVIISTLAMAARKRNLLWSLAAGAGAAAISFAVYVYLYV